MDKPHKKPVMPVSFSVCRTRVHMNIGATTFHLPKANFVDLVHAANGLLAQMAQNGLLDGLENSMSDSLRDSASTTH